MKEEREKDDYNVRNYAYHIYFAYTVVLYGSLGFFCFFSPQNALSYYHGLVDLGPAGIYYARHAAALMLVMAFSTAMSWRSPSAPVRDLLIKVTLSSSLFPLFLPLLRSVRGLFFCSRQEYPTQNI